MAIFGLRLRRVVEAHGLVVLGVERGTLVLCFIIGRSRHDLVGLPSLGHCHYGEGKYLTFGPSMKSVKKVCANIYVELGAVRKPLDEEQTTLNRISQLHSLDDSLFLSRTKC